MKYFLADKAVMITELVGLCFLMFANAHMPKRTIRWTVAAMVMLVLDAVMYRVEDWTQTLETLNPLRIITTHGIYIIQPLIMIAAIQIMAPLKKKQWIIAIPLLISVPIFVTSQFTQIVCWFSYDNHYHGGPVSFLPYMIFGFYVFVFIIQCFLYFGRSHTAERIGIAVIVICGMFNVVYLALLEDYASHDFSDIFTAELLLFYLFLYIYSSKIDTLTGLLNRQCFKRDMERKMKRIGAVVSADMNELKWINDIFGHAEGDKAIKTVAKCLTGGRDKNVYRIGGDEFEIFYFTDDEEKVLSDLRKIRKKLGETPYECAIGYAMVKKGEDIETAVKLADRAMYKNKAELKKAVLDSGGQLHRRSSDYGN